MVLRPSQKNKLTHSSPVNSINFSGRWNTKTTRMSTVKYYLNAENEVITGSDTWSYLLVRRYYVHPDSCPPKSVKKIVWAIRSKNGLQGNAIITYNISPNSVIRGKCHGNARNDSAGSYLRTPPSLLDKMKELRKTMPSKEIIPTLIRQYGGTEIIESQQKILPGNDMQLYNMFRAKVATSDVFARGTVGTKVMDLLKLSGIGFIGCIRIRRFGFAGTFAGIQKNALY